MAEQNVFVSVRLESFDPEQGPKFGQGDSDRKLPLKNHADDKMDTSSSDASSCDEEALMEEVIDEKTAETRSIVLTLRSTTIHDLPNPLLMHILSFLDIKTRFRTELVCKRWRRVVKEFPWSSPTELVVTGNVSKSSLNMSISKLNDNILRKILSRCGPCLKLITLKTAISGDVPTEVTRDSVFEIGQYCHNLERIKLRLPVDNACLKALASGCPKLKSVKITNSGNEEYTDGLLDIVHESHSLEFLRLSDLCLTSDWFKLVNRKLKILHLENCELTHDGMLSLINRCYCLEEFQLDNWKRNPVNEAIVFEILDNFKNTLKAVKLKDLAIKNDNSWSQGLQELRHLKVLVLAFCELVNDDLLTVISEEFSKLTTLDVSDSKITDDGLADLASLPALTALDISYTSVTGEGLKVVACRGMLQEVVMQGMAKVTECNCCFLAKVCPNIHAVDVCGTKQITNRTVGIFCAALKNGVLKGPIKLYCESTSVTRNVATREGVEVYFPVFVPRVISLDNLDSFLNRPDVPNELQSLFGKLAGEVWREQNRTRSIFGFPTPRNELLNRATTFFESLGSRNIVPDRVRLFFADLMG